MPKDRVQIQLLPLGQVFQVERGAGLQDLLFGLGVEFPCGGRGRCKGCRVRVVSGSLPAGHEDRSRLSQEELAAGWRLACRARPESDLTLDLAQWETAILSDNTPFSFQPRPGLGVAIDLGTTTIVAQLLDLQSGQVLGVKTALNEQARYGADVMSRVEFAMADEGQKKLEKIIRGQINGLIQELLDGVPSQESRRSLESVVLVGNTVMHHLFCGISIEPLSHYPFEPASPGLQKFSPASLEWELPENSKIYFLPCLGGFVGSDILAGILATHLNLRNSPAMLIDLGTNGEIVLGNRERLTCAATAAGPAFEGARISMGMRASSGAVSEVQVSEGQLHCHVLGGGPPRGICGSGLVDAVAAGLQLGWVAPNGRFSKGQLLELIDPVTLNQRDIRELQLAKGAIAAGVRLLLDHWGIRPGDLSQVFLAGAFGNYINQSNARRIGLLQFEADTIVASGNTALLGAKMALFDLGHQNISYPSILQCTTHISLNEVPGFQEAYVEEMVFPENTAL